MAWAEEQSWFGLEPEDIKDIQVHYENSLKSLLVNHNIWTTKDNRHINIKDMSIEHLKNSINKCKREDWRMWAIPILEKELNIR